MYQLPTAEELVKKLMQSENLIYVRFTREIHQINTSVAGQQSVKRTEDHKQIFYVVNKEIPEYYFFLVLNVKVGNDYHEARLLLDFLKVPFENVSAELFMSLLSQRALNQSALYLKRETIHWEWDQFPTVWKRTSIDVETILIDTLALFSEVSKVLQVILPIDGQLSELHQQLKDSIHNLS